MANKHIKRINALLNKTAEISLSGRKRVIYPVKIISFAVISVIVLSFIISFIFSAKGTDNVNIGFEMGNDYKATAAGTTVALSNNRGVTGIADNGKIKWRIEKALSEPTLDTRGEYLLLYDMEGKHFAASYKNGKQKNEYNIENDIISAKITHRGYAAFATETDGYKGRVVVFDKKGKLKFEWKNGGGYISDIDITENGKYLAVAQFSAGETEIVSKINFIDTVRGDIIGSVERPNEIIANIKFFNPDKLIVMTDSNMIGYNHKGKELFVTSLVGKSPTFYDLRSDKLIGIVTHDNRGNSVLEFYSMGGKLRSSYVASGEIRGLSVRGNTAIIADRNGVVRVSASGRAKSVKQISHDIKDIELFESSNRALVVGAAQAEVMGVR